MVSSKSCLILSTTGFGLGLLMFNRPLIRFDERGYQITQSNYNFLKITGLIVMILISKILTVLKYTDVLYKNLCLTKTFAIKV